MFINVTGDVIENLPGIVFGKVKIFLDIKLSDLHSILSEDTAIY
jgi:hypothetical protein